MNKVTLIGRLTKDVELTSYGKGKNAGVYANVCVAIRAGIDNEGEQKTDFIYVTLWNRTAEIAAEYAKKGDLVALAGRVRDTSYEDEEGKYHVRSEISINEIELLGSARKPAEDDEDDKDSGKKNRKASRKG